MITSTLEKDLIRKDITTLRFSPNRLDRAFQGPIDWQKMIGEHSPLKIFGLRDKGLNIAYEAVSKQAKGLLSEKTAIRFLRSDGSIKDYSYAELDRETEVFARGLEKLDLKKGDRVFSLLGRIPQLYISIFGSLKKGLIFCSLFSAFGPEPILTRLNLGEATVLITTHSLYQKRVLQIRSQCPSLKTVILVPDLSGQSKSIPDTVGWDEFCASTNRCIDFSKTVIPNTTAEDPALLHFTSGTTGKPKGVLHAHQAVVYHAFSAKIALDLQVEDRFWCTADPGWVTGTSYGLIAPLVCGVTLIVDEMDYDPLRWLNVLEKQQVSVWYTAPTALRMMMKEQTPSLQKPSQDLEDLKELSLTDQSCSETQFSRSIAAETNLSSMRHFPALRFIASVGEPLNPEAVLWGLRVFGLPIHDNWWQTETGGIMIANDISMNIKPGSMGKPLPGIEAHVVHRNPDGKLEFLKPGEIGEIALKKGWPSMFRAYLNQEEKYRRCFVENWYLTGDLAKVDQDGYFWFVGRADEMIKSSGHFVGPFEVETALMEHPAVAEAAVIGKPDPLVHELIKAFVSLKKGVSITESLKMELLGFARKKLGANLAPKEIEILPDLPKTRSGKILRRLLKARELGLPEGDTSTLEGRK